MKLTILIRIVLLISFLGYSTACQVNAGMDPMKDATVILSEVPATQEIPAASPTPEASPTPLQPSLLLVAPIEGDPALKASIQAVLQELASTADLSLLTLESFRPGSIETDIKGLVILPPDPGATSLAQAFPKTPVLAIDLPGLQPGANLSVLPVGDGRPDIQGFLAGYIAAVVTPDWRVGVISQGDVPQGKSSSLGFKNGVIFFCGLCSPSSPPYLTYPVEISLPSQAGEAEIQTAVTSLVNSGVKTVYVAPLVKNEALLEALAQAGLFIIGSQPPPPGLENNWIASVQVDLAEALRMVGADWLAGIDTSMLTDDQATLPVGFFHANADLFSPGRQGLVADLQAELLNGYIDTGVDLSNGENQP